MINTKAESIACLLLLNNVH